MSKKILALHSQKNILGSLDLVLGNWGYPLVTVFSPQELNSRLKKIKPRLLLVEGALLAHEQLSSFPLLSRLVKSKETIIAQLGPGTSISGLPAHFMLELPLNIFALYDMIQKCLEAIPRQDVRVKVRLPGMVRPGDKHFNLGEVLCLSAGGMFIRSGTPITTGTKLEIILPLLGMKRELEVTGEVIYQVVPSAENNYNQGIGIQFDRISSDARKLLEKYLEMRLVDDLSEHLGLDAGKDPLFIWKTG